VYFICILLKKGIENASSNSAKHLFSIKAPSPRPWISVAEGVPVNGNRKNACDKYAEEKSIGVMHAL
jgi:hypothetical protein